MGGDFPTSEAAEEFADNLSELGRRKRPERLLGDFWGWDGEGEMEAGVAEPLPLPLFRIVGSVSSSWGGLVVTDLAVGAGGLEASLVFTEGVLSFAWSVIRRLNVNECKTSNVDHCRCREDPRARESTEAKKANRSHLYWNDGATSSRRHRERPPCLLLIKSISRMTEALEFQNSRKEAGEGQAQPVTLQRTGSM